MPVASGASSYEPNTAISSGELSNALPDPLERIGVRQHVCVDEDEDVTGCAVRPVVAGGGRSGEFALVDDDDFLGRVVRAANCLQAPRERVRAIRGGDDGRQRRAAGHTGNRREAAQFVIVTGTPGLMRCTSQRIVALARRMQP